jgi:hypothetical protein
MLQNIFLDTIADKVHALGGISTMLLTIQATMCERKHRKHVPSKKH